MHPHDPHRFPLVHTPHVQVDACACGHVHITVGVITLRLESGAFLHLVSTLVAATQRLEPRGERAWPAPKVEA